MVQSAPVINPGITGKDVEITGNFSQGQAKDLALILRYGSLPVQFVRRRRGAVSPTLGKDQLKAGIVSGLIGLGLVALYMVFFYRLLGLVVWIGHRPHRDAVLRRPSSCRAAHRPHADAAGVTGIIVSVGRDRRLLCRLFRAPQRRGPYRRPCGRRLDRASAAPRSARSSPPTSCRSSARRALPVRDHAGEGLRVVPRHLDRDRPRCSRTASCGRSCRCWPAGPRWSVCRVSGSAPALDVPGAVRHAPLRPSRRRFRGPAGCHPRGTGLPTSTTSARTSSSSSTSRRWAILSGTLVDLELRALVRPRPQLRHRLRGRHLVAGPDGARQTGPRRRRARPAAPLGFSDAKVSTLSGVNGQSVERAGAPRLRPHHHDSGLARGE